MRIKSFLATHKTLFNYDDYVGERLCEAIKRKRPKSGIRAFFLEPEDIEDAILYCKRNGWRKEEDIFLSVLESLDRDESAVRVVLEFDAG